MKKKDDSIRNSIRELISAGKSAKEKKRQVRQECPHQSSKGHANLKPVYNDDGEPIKGLLKCKRCGAKIDLRPLRPSNNESMLDKVKSAHKVMTSASQYLKLSSNTTRKEDEPIFNMATKCEKATYRVYKIFKALDKRKHIKNKNKIRQKRMAGLRTFGGGTSFR